MYAFFAQYSSGSGSRSYSSVELLIGGLILALTLWCAYKTFANDRMVLFVLGFCFPVCWIIGAMMGKSRRY